MENENEILIRPTAEGQVRILMPLHSARRLMIGLEELNGMHLSEFFVSKADAHDAHREFGGMVTGLGWALDRLLEVTPDGAL